MPLCNLQLSRRHGFVGLSKMCELPVRKIPVIGKEVVKSVTPAIPSTSPEDTVPSEEDPDPKKDENPDANNPEQEENQNGDPDSDPEEEPEPEKEQADLLHTEPSNVPDQREEEES